MHANTCDGCGQSFEAARSDARYCSGRCRTLAYRQRRQPAPRRRPLLRPQLGAALVELERVTRRLARLAADDRAPTLLAEPATRARLAEAHDLLHDLTKPEPSAPARTPAPQPSPTNRAVTDVRAQATPQPATVTPNTEAPNAAEPSQPAPSVTAPAPPAAPGRYWITSGTRGAWHLAGPTEPDRALCGRRLTAAIDDHAGEQPPGRSCKACIGHTPAANHHSGVSAVGSVTNVGSVSALRAVTTVQAAGQS